MQRMAGCVSTALALLVPLNAMVIIALSKGTGCNQSTCIWVTFTLLTPFNTMTCFRTDIQYKSALCAKPD